MSFKEVKKVQEQAKEIAKLLKKEGYRAGLIALGTDNTIAVNPFGNKKELILRALYSSCVTVTLP